MKTLAAAVAVLLLGSAGVAVAQQAGMMDCCKSCACCKDKGEAKPDAKPADKGAHQH